MDLAVLVALGWFWLTFYSVGPPTTWSQVGVGDLSGEPEFDVRGRRLAVSGSRNRSAKGAVGLRPASPAPEGRAAPRR